MAAPVVMVAYKLLKSWQFWVGVTIFTSASAFSLMGMLNLLLQSTLNLWPLLALVGLIIVLREVVRQYFKYKHDEMLRGRKDD